MDIIEFKSEFSTYDKIISSKYATLFIVFILAITGFLNLLFQSLALSIIAGIMFLLMSVLAFLSFIQGKPFFSGRK
jgi:hypothetical protein